MSQATLHPIPSSPGGRPEAGDPGPRPQVGDPTARLLKLLHASPAVLVEVDRLLDGKAGTDPAPTRGPLLLGMGAGAKFLGVSRATLWRLTRAGRLPKVELLPGSFRVRRADLEALAAGKGVAP